MRTCLLFGILLLSSAAGCSGYVGQARRDYAEGRYLEAAEQLNQHEADVERLSPRRQAEYGLYRGLSLMMLGDYAGAHQWLSFAYGLERQEPGTLKPEQRAELDRGLHQLAAAITGAPVPGGAVVVPGVAVPSRAGPPAGRAVSGTGPREEGAAAPPGAESARPDARETPAGGGAEQRMPAAPSSQQQ